VAYKKPFKKYERIDFKKTVKPTVEVPEVKADWGALLQEALTKPGVMATCYRNFHNYSIGNQMFILWQMQARKIEIGPVNTFVRWAKLERPVRKGEKAITICVPRTFTKKDKNAVDGDNSGDKHGMYFTWQRCLFAISQTEGGAEYVPEPIPGFDVVRALESFNITLGKFDSLNGNAQGYANKDGIALNPTAEHPMGTIIHEIAHVVLGHTDGGFQTDVTKAIPKHVKELEAEAVSYIVGVSLGFSSDDEQSASRAYIQDWYKGNTVPEASVKRIFKAVTAILKAGQGTKESEESIAA
jgi:antirestriction protein ArdC